MSLIREVVGTDRGRPRVHYRQEPLDPTRPVVYTGPVSGPITLSDGTVYEVSPDWIEVASHEHAGELAHHIGVRHEMEGHPLHGPDEPFVHACTDVCGVAKRGD